MSGGVERGFANALLMRQAMEEIMNNEIVGPAQERLQDEHLAGEHAEFIDMDCGKCLDEAKELRMITEQIPAIREGLTFEVEGRLVIESSEAGFSPGEWPREVCVVGPDQSPLDTSRRFDLARVDDSWATYIGEAGRELRVLND